MRKNQLLVAAQSAAQARSAEAETYDFACFGARFRTIGEQPITGRPVSGKKRMHGERRANDVRKISESDAKLYLLDGDSREVLHNVLHNRFPKRPETA